jgi:alkylhydroperoxidase family enzyme
LWAAQEAAALQRSIQMTRLSKLPVQDWDSDLRALTQADSATPLEQGMTRVLAHSPEVAKAVVRFGGALLQSTRLPRRLIELVRLRIAFHNQCRSCMAIRYQSAIDDGLTEGMVCSLEKPLEAPDLTDAEKAAVAYADISSTDHFSIDDRTFSNLRQFFSEAEIVELGAFIAYFIGFGRLAASMDMVEELPPVFQDKTDKAAPWLQDGVRLRG